MTAPLSVDTSATGWIHDIDIVDSHVHFTNRETLRQDWLWKADNPLHHNFKDWTRADYAAVTKGYRVKQVVFVEVDVDPRDAAAEALWVEHMIQEDSKDATSSGVVRIGGLVAHAPLHLGADAVKAHLDRIHHAGLKGVRRLTQAEADVNLCLQKDFVEAVQELGRRDLVCDMGIKFWNLPSTIALIKQCPKVTFVIDHIAKPDIKSYWDCVRAGNASVDKSGTADKDGDGRPVFDLDTWKDHMQQLADLPNVYCKISGVATEADHTAWTPEQLRPFIIHCLNTFGYDRCMFGCDWFVATQATTFDQWINLVATVVTELNASPAQRAALFANTAIKVYNLSS